MSAFAQTSSGDLDITTGNLVVRKDVGQVTAWKLSNLFCFFKGEWFLDTRQGLPYVQYVLVSNPNLDRIAQIFQTVLLSAPGVALVKSLDLTFLTNQRKLNAVFQVQANDGSTITGGVGQPFIVNVQGGN